MRRNHSKNTMEMMRDFLFFSYIYIYIYILRRQSKTAVRQGAFVVFSNVDGGYVDWIITLCRRPFNSFSFFMFFFQAWTHFLTFLFFPNVDAGWEDLISALCRRRFKSFVDTAVLSSGTDSQKFSKFKAP